MTRLASVDGHDPTRVITRRCVALTVDALLLAIIPLLTITIVGRATLRRGDCPSPLPRNRNCLALHGQALLVNKGAFLVFFGVLVLLYLALFVVVQGITGATPGKALLGIRVVRPDWSPAGPLRSLVRALAWAVDGIALVLPVALWSAWLTPATAGWATGSPAPSWCAAPSPRAVRPRRVVKLPLWRLSGGGNRRRRASSSSGDGAGGPGGRSRPPSSPSPP
jgi:uncharacterized RDD family membrane protein YckC